MVRRPDLDQQKIKPRLTNIFTAVTVRSIGSNSGASIQATLAILALSGAQRPLQYTPRNGLDSDIGRGTGWRVVNGEGLIRQQEVAGD